MLKVAIPTDSKQTLGGGFTFRANFIKGMAGKAQFTDIPDADVVLITSSSMVVSETVERCQALKKKIVLRVDNIPRNSRNRNTGTSRLLTFSKAAHAVVYQSAWAQGYISPFLGQTGQVIYNGIDTSIYKKDGVACHFDGDPVYLYSRFNRDETKQWEVAWYEYQLIQRKNPKASLVLVGNFSPELIQYNFDFYNNERVTYLGVIDDPETMASVYRGCNRFLAVYYNDCYSNTYQEFIACGGELYKPSMTGGTPELFVQGVRSIDVMVDEYLKLFQSIV